MDRSPLDKAAYDRNGYAFPIRVLPTEEALDMRRRLDGYRASRQVDPKEDLLLQFKVHMAFEWADRLIRHPAVLDAVEAVIGPDILVWNTAVLLKKPQNRDFVSWHQDVYYWGNHPDHVVGAWIALADSTPENGCVQMIPGSHAWGIIPHVDTFGADNMLSRGQTLDREIDESAAVDVVLRPGEMSLHHTRTVHGSRPNRSGQIRIGFVVTYMAPATTMIGPRTGATLVRGSDTYGHFDLENVRPAYDLEPACLRAHAEATQPLSAALYTGTQKQDARLAPASIAARDARS